MNVCTAPAAATDINFFEKLIFTFNSSRSQGKPFVPSHGMLQQQLPPPRLLCLGMEHKYICAGRSKIETYVLLQLCFIPLRKYYCGGQLGFLV